MCYMTKIRLERGNFTGKPCYSYLDISPKNMPVCRFAILNCPLSKYVECVHGAWSEHPQCIPVSLLRLP